MSKLLLIKPSKCLDCGKYAVFHGMFGKLDSEWIGSRCSACGKEIRDEVETARMIKQFKRMKELYEKGLIQVDKF